MITLFTLTVKDYVYDIHLTQESATAQEARIHRAHPFALTTITTSQVDHLDAQLVTITDLPRFGIVSEVHPLLFQVTDIQAKPYGFIGKIQWCGESITVLYGKLTRTWSTTDLF